MKSYPISNAQKRIWYTQQRYRESSLFNIGGIVKIKGNVKVKALKQAITQLVCKHEALRLQFLIKNTDVIQYISNDSINVDLIDFSKVANPQVSFLQWSQKQAQAPFVMIDRPLYQFVIFQISEVEMGYFIKLHHIIADGWSIKLLTDFVTKDYESIVRNETYKNANLPLYTDYIIEEKNYIASSAYENSKRYWNELFSPLPESYNISSDHLEGERISYILEEAFFNRIEQYIKKYSISLNTFIVCLYILYEYKKNGKKDIVIGLPLLGRAGIKERSTFGTFTNTMPYRYKVSPEQSITETMTQLSYELKLCYMNQKYPYNMLHEELELNKNGRNRLYDVCINYYNTFINTSIDHMPIENMEFYNGQQEYAMQIILRHWDGIKLQLDYDYQKAVYTNKQINEINQSFMILINQILEEEEIRVKQLVLLEKEDEDKFIFDFNHTKKEFPQNKTWMDIFCCNLQKYSERIAISYQKEHITYRELSDKINQAVRYLISIGVKRGDIIGILPRHNIESIIAILAIMKGGGVYLPIDVHSPINRIYEITQNSGAKYLISDESIINYTGSYVPMKELLSYEGITESFNDILPSDIAYMIYTSGSTGVSKAVVINHRNIMNYLCWAKDTYIKKENEVFALYSSFAFDFTMTSLFLPLINGSEIRVYENARNSNIFEYILKDNRATIVKITPSHISLINDVTFQNISIHTFIIGGENLKVEVCKGLYRKFSEKVSIYNEYGPTEATIGCMTYLYGQDELDGCDAVPIGKPILNTQIYVLDIDLRPVPYETVGEIYIAGECISQGYYNNDDETRKRFLESPYLDGEIIYKTGDLAIRHVNNDIIFVGRNDDEIKIRGYRVSLSEIEQKILESTMAKDAVVKLLDIGDEKQLCAYLIARQNYKRDELKKYLENCLPVYMIPEIYVTLDQFPLTVNGKMDLKKFPKPMRQSGKASNTELTLEEELILNAIKQIIPSKNIKAEDNFYAIGGDSIKAIQISSRLNEKGYELSVRDILTNPILGSMSKFIKLNKNPECEQGICSGEVMKTPIISWFLEQKFKEEGYYNQSVLLDLKKDIPIETLNRVFIELVRHHDVLRLNYDMETDCLFYNNLHLDKKEIVELMYMEASEYEEINLLIGINVNHNFILNQELLIRAYMFVMPEQNYLYITAHHLVIDGVSWRIILEDIATLLKQIDSEQRPILQEKTTSFIEYAKEYFQWAEKLHIEKKYWDEINIKGHNMFHDKVSTYGQQKTISMELNEEITGLLLGKANSSYNTKPNELLLISFARTYKEVLNANELIVEVEHHGRDTLDKINILRTVGWFTNMFPMKLSLQSHDLIEQIKSLSKQIKKVSKKGHEYGILRYYKREMSIARQTIRFNYLGEYTDLSNNYLSLRKVLFDGNDNQQSTQTYLIDVNAIVVNKKLEIYFKYNQVVVDNNMMAEFVQCYKEQCHIVIQYCALNV